MAGIHRRGHVNTGPKCKNDCSRHKEIPHPNYRDTLIYGIQCSECVIHVLYQRDWELNQRNKKKSGEWGIWLPLCRNNGCCCCCCCFGVLIFGRASVRGRGPRRRTPEHGEVRPDKFPNFGEVFPGREFRKTPCNLRQLLQGSLFLPVPRGARWGGWDGLVKTETNTWETCRFNYSIPHKSTGSDRISPGASWGPGKKFPLIRYIWSQTAFPLH